MDFPVRLKDTSPAACFTVLKLLEANMIIYWLVLIYSFTTGTNAATSSMLHVGNFKDLKECQAAGTAAGGRDVLFVCVQANDTGANPPP